MAALAFAMGTAALPAWSAPDPEAAALFDEGRKLMGKGDYAGAIPKFQKILEKQKAVGALLNLAECYQKTGKVATAWKTFKEAANVARETNDSERAKVAEDRATALEPQLAKLTITVEKEAEGLEIHRDGELVPKSEWGAPVPVDLGSHRVEAVLAGHPPWVQTVEVAGTGTVVLVPAFGGEKPAETTKPFPETKEAPPAESGGRLSRKTLGIIVGGAGAAGLVFGTVTGLLAMSSHDDAKSKCTEYPNRCASDGSAQGPNDDAQTFATMSTIGFIAGGVLLVSGAALYLTAPTTTTAKLKIVPAMSAYGGSMMIGGRF